MDANYSYKNKAMEVDPNLEQAQVLFAMLNTRLKALVERPSGLVQHKE